MKIVGVAELSVEALQHELEKGARFVRFEYCISLLIVTFRRSTDVHLIKSGESTFLKSLPYTLLSLLLGWWGIPWGPVYTIGALLTNLGGGKDVTQQIMNA